MYLKCEGISISFKKQIVLNDANLLIDKPGFYCLVGRNGCGKSTLMKIIAGRLKQDKGNVEIKGDKGEKLMVSYLPADPIVADNLTVLDNLRLVSKDNDKIDFYLKLFEIENISNLKSSKCSAGERQRLCLAINLLQDNPIILFDEITSHIDDYISKKILNHLKDISTKKIIIYATHYEKEVSQYAIDIIRINNGKINFTGNNDYDYKIVNTPNKYKNNKILNKIIIWKGDIIFLFLSLIIIPILAYMIRLANLNANKMAANELNYKKDDYVYIDLVGLTSPFIPNRSLSHLINCNLNDEFGICYELFDRYMYVDSKQESVRLTSLDRVFIDDEIEDDIIYISPMTLSIARGEGIIDDDSNIILWDHTYKYKMIKSNSETFSCNKNTLFKILFDVHHYDEVNLYIDDINFDLIAGSVPEQGSDRMLIAKEEYEDVQDYYNGMEDFLKKNEIYSGIIDNIRIKDRKKFKAEVLKYKYLLFFPFIWKDSAEINYQILEPVNYKGEKVNVEWITKYIKNSAKITPNDCKIYEMGYGFISNGRESVYDLYTYRKNISFYINCVTVILSSIFCITYALFIFLFKQDNYRRMNFFKMINADFKSVSKRYAFYYLLQTLVFLIIGLFVYANIFSLLNNALFSDVTKINSNNKSFSLDFRMFFAFFSIFIILQLIRYLMVSKELKRD